MTEQEAAADQPEKKGKKVKVQAPPKEVSQMKAGDYTLHLLIQKAKDLEIDCEDVMNVVCEITVQTQKEVSKELKDVTSTTVCNFDSHVFIELMGQTVAQLEQTKIMVKLQSKGFFKTALIGQVELDLTFIYNQDNHTRQHQWIALINPDSEDFASVAAYLKMSASVYGVDDTPVELKMDDNDDDDNCIMPASIKPKYTQLKMHIVKGEHLPKLDVKLIGAGSMDAFITAKIGGKLIKTAIKVTEKDEAVWNQTFLIPVRMPIMAGKLILNVMDLDTVKDEQAGALIFDFHDLLQREQKSFFWANIYGAPGQEEVKVFDGSSDVADEMNKDPIKATKWKGRILIGIEHFEEESPKLGVEFMSTMPPQDSEGNEIEGERSIVDISKDFMNPVKYKLMYEFNSCLNTPEHNGKYNMQLAIGENTWTSLNDEKSRAVGFNYNRWNQRSEEIEFEVPYGEVKDMDDIFLYLAPDKGGLGGIFGGGKGDKKVGKVISYMKLRAADYMDPNPALQWVELLEETVEDALDSPEKAGVVGFRLSIVRADSGIELKQQENWKKRLPRRPESAKVRCYLFQCKDLPAADEDGSSDPKVIVFNTVDHDSDKKRMLKQVQQTITVDNNCDPMFYQLLELKIDYTKGEELPPFIFDIYDVDKKIIGDDDLDYIGRAVVHLKDSAHKRVSEDDDSVDLRPEVPKWHPVRFQSDSPKAGEILVSFVLTEEFDHNWKLPNESVKMMGLKDDSAVVRFDEYKVELNVLGLRGLVSPGLLPVKKAYIDFLLKSMVPPMAASALESIQTQPGPAGSDPTINSVISFSVPMPCDDLYAPSMSCRVYDKVFKGFSGQLIGCFTIPIGAIMRDQRVEYEENCQNLDTIIKALEDVLEEKAILDYEPVNPNVDSKITEDKGFRKEARAQKAAYVKALEADPVEEQKSFTAKIASKIAPEVVKPTSALQKRLGNQKKTQLKKRLILNTDDDSDDDGTEFTNPVALRDTERTKYIPPSLNLNAINGSVASTDLDNLAHTPRSQLSNQEKREVDRAAVLDAISAKSDPDKLKNMTPRSGQKFKPPTATRLSQQDVEDAIRANSGVNTPVSANRSIKQFTPSKVGINRELMEMAKSEEAAIVRETETARQSAEKEMEAKTGGKEVRMINEPKYVHDERIGCLREIQEDKPNPILFEELGWDRIPGESKEKHYRKFVAEELEHCKTVMSAPSEFQQYHLKKGQARGAKKSMFDFGGAKTDQATGEQDTTTDMGLFKALITVTHKETELETKMFLLDKLSKIRRLLAEIYVKRNPKKPFPLPEGFFCENALEGSKVLNANQRGRAYSDEIKGPDDVGFGAMLTSKTHTSFHFDDRASTILNQEGRTMFKELMRSLKLTHLQIMRCIVDVQSDEIIKRLLMSEAKCNVRVYIVRAFNLAARDNDSPSDPYVKVILGEDERSDRKNYKEDDASPDIYQMYEFQAIFPGCPLMQIEFWDYDLLFGDDLIGTTTIDLEDRYFSCDWKAIIHKPIEYRKLHHYSTEMSQGTCVLWTEINEQHAPAESQPIWDISKKPTEDFQLRVVVWDTVDLEMMDAEGTTDGFVRCFFDSEERKDTDTHFRNQDGKCSWNYRMLFPFTYPCKNYKFTIQAYDLDLFKSNDLIGQTVLDLETLFEDSELAKRPMALTKDYYDEFLAPEKGWKGLEFEKEDPRQFWVCLTAKNEKGELVTKGKLKMSIELLPKKEADLNPVGEAQSEPNVNPFLPKPFGRIEFSINPFKMLAQLVGPALRRKLYCYCCCILCCALCVMMAPMIFSNIISNALTPG